MDEISRNQDLTHRLQWQEVIFIFKQHHALAGKLAC
jgi:hypothetical protein